MDPITLALITGYAPMATAIVVLWRKNEKNRDKFEEHILNQAKEHERVMSEMKRRFELNRRK